jgi:hypothetical protein
MIQRYDWDVDGMQRNDKDGRYVWESDARADHLASLRRVRVTLSGLVDDAYGSGNKDAYRYFTHAIAIIDEAIKEAGA